MELYYPRRASLIMCIIWLLALITGILLLYYFSREDMTYREQKAAFALLSLVACSIWQLYDWICEIFHIGPDIMINEEGLYIRRTMKKKIPWSEIQGFSVGGVNRNDNISDVSSLRHIRFKLSNNKEYMKSSFDKLNEAIIILWRVDKKPKEIINKLLNHLPLIDDQKSKVAGYDQKTGRSLFSGDGNDLRNMVVAVLENPKLRYFRVMRDRYDPQNISRSEVLVHFDTMKIRITIPDGNKKRIEITSFDAVTGDYFELENVMMALVPTANDQVWHQNELQEAIVGIYENKRFLLDAFSEDNFERTKLQIEQKMSEQDTV